MSKVNNNNNVKLIKLRLYLGHLNSQHVCLFTRTLYILDITIIIISLLYNINKIANIVDARQ